MPDSTSITDALRAAQKRGELPTSLGTEELRELGMDVLARSVFTARGTNAVFVSKLKEVVDELASGNLDEASARWALLQTLRAVGYTPEGGFPDAPAGSVPPAVAGSLQDLSSFRRLDLIVRTQRELMIGAGQKMRGEDPVRLQSAPAWELVRQLPVDAPRDWAARWVISGGALVDGGRMIALKGDPIWGELGSYDNFDDALGVDHPPFAFNSGMGWREMAASEVTRLGITGPDGETPEEWQASQPRTLTGKQALPAPAISLRDMDPDVRKKFLDDTSAVTRDDMATTPAGKTAQDDRAASLAARRQALIDRAVSAADAAYQKGGKQ